jgi:hypothetical protein
MISAAGLMENEHARKYQCREEISFEIFDEGTGTRNISPNRSTCPSMLYSKIINGQAKKRRRYFASYF